MIKVRKDLTGKQFGQLIVLEQADDYIFPNGKVISNWKCQCSCGNQCTSTRPSLINRNNPNCGCMDSRYVDLTGKMFGRIKVVRFLRVENRNAVFSCECKCGNVFEAKGVQLTRTKGSNCCKKCHVIDGQNDIPSKAPWMISYFKDKNDQYKFSYQSSRKVHCQCPDCGNEKDVVVKDLYRHRSIGCICSDNISYPEKFMYALLTNANIDFQYQYSPPWLHPLISDFYIPSLKLIVELDGGLGHGNKGFKNVDVSESIERDQRKDKLVYEHGLSMLRINVDDKFDVIENRIVNSIKTLIDLNDVDIKKCINFAMSNFAKTICKAWVNLSDVQSICKYYKISDMTVRAYLKKGTQLGWCDYYPEIEKEINKINHIIQVFDGDMELGYFKGFADFARYYNNSFTDKSINAKAMANSYKKHSKYKGLTVKVVM